jgi:hypothetical protein
VRLAPTGAVLLAFAGRVGGCGRGRCGGGRRRGQHVCVRRCTARRPRWAPRPWRMPAWRTCLWPSWPGRPPAPGAARPGTLTCPPRPRPAPPARRAPTARCPQRPPRAAAACAAGALANGLDGRHCGLHCLPRRLLLHACRAPRPPAACTACAPRARSAWRGPPTAPRSCFPGSYFNATGPSVRGLRPGHLRRAPGAANCTACARAPARASRAAAPTQSAAPRAPGQVLCGGPRAPPAAPACAVGTYQPVRRAPPAAPSAAWARTARPLWAPPRAWRAPRRVRCLLAGATAATGLRRGGVLGRHWAPRAPRPAPRAPRARTAG